MGVEEFLAERGGHASPRNGGNRQIGSTPPSGKPYIDSEPQTNRIRQNLRLSKRRLHLSQREFKQADDILQAGYMPLKKMKGDKVILAKSLDSSQLIILKRVPEEDRIETYKSMLESFNLNREKFKRLYVPNHLGRFDIFDLFEYIPGYSVHWTENFSEPGFGGVGIQKIFGNEILDVSEDLDILGYANGDFYWRNFIFRESGTVGIVDWDRIIPSDNSNESRIVYIFCLTFNNEELRNEILGGALARGFISKSGFRKKVLKTIQKFSQKWSDRSNLVDQLQRIHGQFNDDSNFERFWNNLSGRLSRRI
jgi:hypothetical protein